MDACVIVKFRHFLTFRHRVIDESLIELRLLCNSSVCENVKRHAQTKRENAKNVEVEGVE
jgi:hypothetical protein